MQGPSGRSTNDSEFTEICRSLADRSPHATLAVDGEARIVRYANLAFSELLGKDYPEFVGLQLADVLPSMATKRLSDCIGRVLEGGPPEHLLEEESGPGIKIGLDAHWCFSVWMISDGVDARKAAVIQITDLSEAVTFRRDSRAMNEALLLSSVREREHGEHTERANARLAGEISERQVAQEALATLADDLEKKVLERTLELRKSNRTMQGFVYAVVHNLRAPLRAIVATSSVLMEEVGEVLSIPHKELLVRQTRNALGLSSLIDDLVKYAHLADRPVRRTSLDLSALAGGVAKALTVEYPDRTFDFRIEDGLEAFADPDATLKVLRNILGNAAKFSPHGGKIMMGRVEGSDGAFFVRDEGIGFDMDHTSRLFEPFERLVGENEFPGNGIGLAKVKRIVEMHGGTVWTQSVAGQGATFFFTLSKSSEDGFSIEAPTS